MERRAGFAVGRGLVWPMPTTRVHARGAPTMWRHGVIAGAMGADFAGWPFVSRAQIAGLTIPRSLLLRAGGVIE